MPSPFHHDVRRDAQGQGGDDESATAGVGAEEFPLGMAFVRAEVAFVGRDSYLLIDTGESAEFIDITIHCPVGAVRQGLIIVKGSILGGPEG